MILEEFHGRMWVREYRDITEKIDGLPLKGAIEALQEIHAEIYEEGAREAIIRVSTEGVGGPLPRSEICLSYLRPETPEEKQHRRDSGQYFPDLRREDAKEAKTL